MNKPIWSLILLLILITSIVMLSGCTSNNQTSQQGGAGTQADNGNGPGMMPENQSAPPQGGVPPADAGNRSGMMRNLTDAQRQQFFQEQMQACQNKTEGDSCTVQTPMGERSGTCKTMNETLSCVTGMEGPMRGNRSANSG